MEDDLDRQIAGIAALDQPLRRDLYRYVADHTEVSRDQVAEAMGISRTLAAFHLDKLVEDGLLEVAFRRLTGRSGPGAGRPSKLYRRSALQLQVTLPPRSYELAARLLAEAVAEADSPQVERVLDRAARRFGEDVGAQERAGSEEAGDAIQTVLQRCGYEPTRRQDGAICLRNCPFHVLAQEHQSLVCGMNLSLLEGMVEGLGAPNVEPVLAPQPGMCCVVLKPTES